MIIDITYIKNVLNTEVEDSVINYLIKHFFNYVCNEIMLDTTLEEEEIATVVADTPKIPNILEDDLTLFQETIIYGIGCELTETDILTTINSQIQEKYKDTIEDVTYCNVFDYCLKQLDEYLNSKSEVETLRILFGLKKEDVSDNELSFLLQYYTDYILSYMPEDQEIDTESPFFKQALYALIACHIYKVNPTAIINPRSYKVDEVMEIFTLNFDKMNNTWCDLANEAFATLKKKTYNLYGIYAYDRPGARTKYGYHGPGG